MRAVVREEYGSPDVLTLQEVERPSPEDNEVLVKIHASSVNAGDWRRLRGEPRVFRFMGMGVRTPKIKILGNDTAGRVEAVGSKVTRFQPGDEVFGESDGGGFAEYARVAEDALALKPANISFEEAAAVPVAALTALQGLRDAGRIQSGQKVLINGASGGVGTYAVQIAKSFGAEVTAVCSTRNMDIASSIGADHVIDYTGEDFTTNGRRYDLILAANGYRTLADYKCALSAAGSYVASGGTMRQIFEAMLLGPWYSVRGSKRLGTMGESKPNGADMAVLAALLESGQVVPVIDSRYALSEVPRAIAHLEGGHARGKVVITV